MILGTTGVCSNNWVFFQTAFHKIFQFISSINVRRKLNLFLKYLFHISFAPNSERTSSNYQFIHNKSHCPDIYWMSILFFSNHFRRYIKRSPTVLITCVFVTDSGPAEVTYLWYALNYDFLYELEDYVLWLDVSVNISHLMNKTKAITEAFSDGLNYLLLKSRVSFQSVINRSFWSIF